MKKILTIMCLMLATLTFGQTPKSNLFESNPLIKITDTSYVSEKPISSIKPYVSVGLSMSNTSDFRNGSFFGVESGVYKENVSLGVVLGRGSVRGAFKNGDVITNYFYEPKITVSFPLGKLYGTAIFGAGGYFGTSNTFIEYGGGVYYQVGKVAYGVLYSNWDGIDYITPNITYNF